VKQGRPDVLDVRYKIGDAQLQMSAAHRPRPADLMLLCALVALAGPAGDAPDAEADGGLLSALECSVQGGTSPLIVRTTRARLLSECGIRDGGAARAALIESLTRLAALSAVVTRGSARVSMRLLSFAVDEANGELAVALSPRLTAAVLGGRHARLELVEMRVLREHARVLYVRLCAWIDPGATRRIRLDVIEGYLWSDAIGDERAADSSVKSRAQWVARDRRRRARAAMSELGRIAGWRVVHDARGVQYTITRPADISLTPADISLTPADISLTPESVVSAQNQSVSAVF
jgi:hypothetical protein